MDGMVLWEVVETERKKFQQGMRLIRVSTHPVVQTCPIVLTVSSSTISLEVLHSANATLLPLQPSARRMQPNGHAFKNAGPATVISQLNIPLPIKVPLWSLPPQPSTLHSAKSLVTLAITLSGPSYFGTFVSFLSAERWNGGACTRTSKSSRNTTGPIWTSPGGSECGRCPTSASRIRARLWPSNVVFNQWNATNAVGIGATRLCTTSDFRAKQRSLDQSLGAWRCGCTVSLISYWKRHIKPHWRRSVFGVVFRGISDAVPGRQCSIPGRRQALAQGHYARFWYSCPAVKHQSACHDRLLGGAVSCGLYRGLHHQ